MLTACRRTPTTAVALSFLLCAMVCTCAYAAENPALQLLRNIKSLQARHGFLAPELLPPLVELGQLYGAGQCDRAIDILDLALEVSRRKEGLFNSAQLEIYEPLLNCYITLDRPADLERAQQYVVLIDEQRYGSDDLRLLPTLEQGARRYEEVGMYLSARRLYRRALDIGRRRAGENDPRLVPSLRGMARAYRQEYAYGLALPDLAHIPYEVPEIISYATFDPMRTRLDRLGQRSLEQAVAILRNHSDSDGYVDTLLELGDWYQLANKPRAALGVYRELWQALDMSESGADGSPDAELLNAPTALLARHNGGSRLRRPLPDPDRYQRYSVDLEYAVTRDGRVKDVAVVESNAPKGIEYKVMRDLKLTRFRPRFLDGEPVDTTGLHHRENFYTPRSSTAETTLAAK